MTDPTANRGKVRRGRKFSALTTLIWIAGILVYLFLISPILVIVLSAFSPTEYPTFPPQALSVRWFTAVFQNSDWWDALRVSLILLVIVTPLTVLLGTAAAYGLGRLKFRGREAIQSLMLSPLMIPQVVLGIALLYEFTSLGIINSLTGLVIGHIVVAFPYVIRVVSVSVTGLDPKLESASMSLGAGRWTTFLRVTLPLIKPGMIAGTVFSIVESFGEVSVSMFVSSPGNITIPVRIFSYIDQTFDPSVNAISVLFIAVAVIALIIIDKSVGLTKVM
ncbi:ABC transporter permease [Paenibacillus sp. XY044]|uniref:ABC transporter permease n=1 Tax=Paenibacillus sp. XY044 TaxID=2026089 RepID=UPI000B98FBCC|nr:ABC transporter permease [Paenibacillus sp. XY044]OZB92220.1 ABC transporter permease [Paenibacillus sp. XY044]